MIELKGKRLRTNEIFAMVLWRWLNKSNAVSGGENVNGEMQHVLHKSYTHTQSTKSYTTCFTWPIKYFVAVSFVNACFSNDLEQIVALAYFTWLSIY